MTIERLDNDVWGFTTNCFVCETKNAAGLQVPYFVDTETETVFAEFTLSAAFSGAPNWAHGGVSLAICDEAMAWATIALKHKWAVTKSSTASFERPVVIDRTYRVEARIIGTAEGDDATILTEASITSASSGKRCVFTTGVMSVVTAVQAPKLGITLDADHATYLRN